MQSSILISNFSSDAVTLKFINASLNIIVVSSDFSTSFRQHIHRLSGIFEQFYADNMILRRENVE